MYKNTKEWLKHSLIINNDTNIVRNNRLWISVAGFSTCGSIFAIYKDDKNYCVHAGDEWKENEEPNLGYYNKDLLYDELICKIADKYDEIRKKLN